MFVFYFGIVADITPPVALAAYAGSAIAKSNPLKTGIEATKLAITAFIVPYIFAYSPTMLLIIEGYEASLFDVISIFATSLIGIYAISSGMEGYMHHQEAIWQRILLIGAGLCMIIPETITDIVGLAVIAFIILFQNVIERKKFENTPVKAEVQNTSEES